MGRELLHKGDKINGSFQYEVESVSGQGASCVVYKARYSDDEKQSHLVQIKEFYPYNLSICRKQNSHNLICIDAEQFESEKCRFIDNAKKLASLNNDEITNSGTPSQIEIFELNNTAYSVVTYDAGNIYNEEDLQTMDLTKILEIIKNLSRAVELFHKNGYVHLDIKPENFLVDNTDHITLFDVDSIVLCDEINAENTHNISYTKKWAAPEVKRATDKVISYTADIFSIGVILFEAIMCRPFLPMETVSYNRNWDVEDSIKAREEKQNRKVNLNPKFYYQIKEIFEKTLDRNPDNRYKTATELYKALDKACDLLKENPWIIPSFRTITPKFTGRKNELAEMNSIMQKEDTVFLHGFGGIGKSELALKYAEKHKEDFDTIVFCKYQDDIKDALSEVRIAHFENDDNAKHLRKFAELCDARTLVILDNFDVETDADDYLDEFINNYHCKKIITTRTDFSGAYKQLEVGALGAEDATSLFEKESEWCHETEDEEETLDEILKLIGYHTYFTVILAKKRKEFSLSIDELKKQTEEMLLKKSGKVTVAKDGKITTSTIDVIASNLFDFNKITENQKQALGSLYLLSWRTVTRNEFSEIAGFGLSNEEKYELIDSLNDLTRLGWILYDEKNDDFFLHQIMQEMVKNYCKETDISANNVLEYYRERCGLVENYSNETRLLLEEAIKQKRIHNNGLDEKKKYINSYRAMDIIYLSDRLFSMSKKNIGKVFEFLENVKAYNNYTVFCKLTRNITEYCCSVECSPETQKKWMSYFIPKELYDASILITNTGLDERLKVYWNKRGFFTSDTQGYAKLCVALYKKLGVSKGSTLNTKKDFWNLIKYYIEFEKSALYLERAETEELKLNEYELKLIRCVEEIKDILNESEINIFEKFKNEEVYIAVSTSPDVPFEPTNSYEKFLDMINNSTCELIKIIEDIHLDKELHDGERELLLIFATAKQNGFMSVLHEILANTELNDDEKSEKLTVLSYINDWAIANYLEKQGDDNIGDYGDFLIFWSENGYGDGKLLLGVYLKNKENFEQALDEVFSNYFLKEHLLDASFWESLCCEFAKFHILNIIFPFVCERINIVLNENNKKDVDEFSFLDLLKTLSHQVYIETKDKHYFEMEKEYTKKIHELPGIKEEIDYRIKE